MIHTLDRSNLLDRRIEAWKPPVFESPGNPRSRVIAALRRIFDLQAASIWNDLKLLLPQVRGEVLDVGCGAQPYRELFHGDVRYRAIDCLHAETDFGYAVPGTIYYGGDRWPVDDASVDFVLCTETLEHVPDAALFLAEAMRCLRPGGRMVLTVPFAARWHFIPYDYWRFTPSGLNRTLQASGFEKISVFGRGNSLTVASYKVMALILPLLFAQVRSLPVRFMRLACGFTFSPLLLISSALGQTSLRGKGGDDCLGYTVLASKSA